MNKEIEERIKTYILSCISPRDYLGTLAQKLVRANNTIDEMNFGRKVDIENCINVVSNEWLKKYCFEAFYNDKYNFQHSYCNRYSILHCISDR